MRIRNVRPEFFADEDLAEVSMEVRLLFIGLFCLADCKGRLEDRPRRIKRQLFPSDSIDVDAGLNELQRIGVLRRYEASGLSLVWICKFTKHQKFSKEERGKGSVFPPHPEDPDHPPTTLAPPSDHPPAIPPRALTADSGQRTTDSGQRTWDAEAPRPPAVVDLLVAGWNESVPEGMRVAANVPARLHAAAVAALTTRPLAQWLPVFAAAAGSPFYNGSDGKRSRGAVDLRYVLEHPDEILTRGKPPAPVVELSPAQRRRL